MPKSTKPTKRPILALDLGDSKTTLAFRRKGRVVHEEIRTQRKVFLERFRDVPPSLVVFEAGSQSPWVGWMLKQLGHEILVLHPKQLKMICSSYRKSDLSDAEWLLEVAEWHPERLVSVRLRSEPLQRDLASLRMRQALTRMRTIAVQSVRSHAKLFGHALPTGGPAALPKRMRELLPADLLTALTPALLQIESLNFAIEALDRTIERLAEVHSATAVLRQVWGIGAMTALAFVLTFQTPHRFDPSRAAGAAVGLVPRKRQSGARDPELSITKTGDVELRRLLVLAAHRLMKTTAPESDLKQFGERLAARGGRNAKKRAVVAVARKLAVVLTALWKSGEVYEPLRQAQHEAQRAAARSTLAAA